MFNRNILLFVEDIINSINAATVELTELKKIIIEVKAKNES